MNAEANHVPGMICLAAYIPQQTDLACVYWTDGVTCSVDFDTPSHAYDYRRMTGDRRLLTEPLEREILWFADVQKRKRNPWRAAWYAPLDEIRAVGATRSDIGDTKPLSIAGEVWVKCNNKKLKKRLADNPHVRRVRLAGARRL